MQTRETLQLLDAFAAGIYLFFGLVYLDLWLKRRDRPGHLWLAGAAAGALTVDLTGMMLRLRDLTSGLLVFVNNLGVVIVTVTLLGLVFSLTEARAGAITRAACVLVLFLALLAGFFGIEPAGPLFFVICMALLLRSLVQALRAARAGEREARTIGVGLIVLILALIIDVLGVMRIAPLIPGLPIVGFASMFLLSASALNGRYAREHRELVVLRHALENRVSERTRELEDANQRLAEASRTDALTGLPNRRGFLDVVGHELERSARAGDPCTLLMIDLDHFKEINDRHGHAAGDAALRKAAAQLRGVLRAVDVIARWGGEEFIALLPNTGVDGAMAVAEKARRALATGSHAVTASFGVAAHRHGQSLDVTVAAADEALYRAKAAGRDRVVVSE